MIVIDGNDPEVVASTERYDVGFKRNGKTSEI
jgi:hypothetical protein